MQPVNTGLSLAKFLIVQSNTYNDQMARPFSTSIDQHVVTQFKEATNYGATFNPTALAGVAGAILRPQAEASASIAIPNGWDQRRFRFNMEFETKHAFGGSIRQVVTGYTDHPGATADGMGMDQNMRLYFNNSIHLQSGSSMAGFGQQETLRIADASHVLFPAGGMRFNGTAATLQTMRPEDVLASISTQSLNDSNVIDYRTAMGTSDIKKSRRGNALAPEYMSKTINAIDQAHKLADSAADHVSIYENARSSVRETLVAQDLFLSILNQHTQYRYNGYITYREFCALFPEAEHVRTLVKAGQTQQQMMMPGRGSTESWHMPTNETVIATILSHSIPAVMVDCMLTKVTFLATNQTLSGQPEIQIRDAASFSSGIDMSPYMQRFIARVSSEVLADITRNNMFGVNIAVTCNIIGDTMIQVSLNSGPAFDYITPSFCDSLIAPVISANPHQLSTIAHDVDMLFSNVHNNSSTQMFAPMGADGSFGNFGNGPAAAMPVSNAAEFQSHLMGDSV